MEIVLKMTYFRHLYGEETTEVEQTPEVDVYSGRFSAVVDIESSIALSNVFQLSYFFDKNQFCQYSKDKIL